MSGVEAIRYGLLQGWSRITLSADEGRGILEALKRIPARTVTIAPDPDSQIRCRHAGGDPDCDCWPECPECGAGYDPREGHDCLDGIEELADAIEEAKRFRDEAAGLREELDALRPKAPEAGARPKDSCQTCDHENGCPNATQEGVCMYHDDAKRGTEDACRHPKIGTGSRNRALYTFAGTPRFQCPLGHPVAATTPEGGAA